MRTSISWEHGAERPSEVALSVASVDPSAKTKFRLRMSLEDGKVQEVLDLYGGISTVDIETFWKESAFGSLAIPKRRLGLLL